MLGRLTGWSAMTMGERAAVDAHLNGGPRDDEYVVVEGYELRVARMERLSADPVDTDAVPYKVGRYEARRDSNGDLVPHDLAGAVEFDFVGWE